MIGDVAELHVDYATDARMHVDRPDAHWVAPCELDLPRPSIISVEESFEHCERFLASNLDSRGGRVRTGTCAEKRNNGQGLSLTQSGCGFSAVSDSFHPAILVTS